jgi:CheY-like chemotaxis protein
MPGSVADALVLIVDDDARNLKLAATCCSPPVPTLVAETGNEAVALAAEHLPDVILMGPPLPGHGRDGRRPDPPGRGEDGRDPRRPAELHLARGGHAWLADAGFAGYLAKPIDIDEFPTMVRRFCARRR